MGFCTDEEYGEFFRSVPEFERMLIRSGIQLIKYWFSISDEEQEFRFRCRINDPLKQWKLSPMDLESRRRWEAYTRAKEVMLERSHIPESPWWVVQANDKKKARLNCIAHLLEQMPYNEIPRAPIVLPERERHASASRTADDGSLATLADGTDYLPRRVAGLAEEPRKRVVTALGSAPESAHLIKQLAPLCRLARAHDLARDRPPIQRAHLILDKSLLPPLSRSDEGALDALKRTHIIPCYIGLLGQERRRHRTRLHEVVVVHLAEDGLPLNLLAVSPNRLYRHVDLLRELSQLGLDIRLSLRSAVHG
jgi:hypothetical protein